MVKRGLVTGGSRGIGRGIAIALAQRGYDVAIVHWADADNAAAVQREIREAYGRECYCAELDLSQPSGPPAAAAFAVDCLERVDVLVNNAGRTEFESTLDVTDAVLQDLFALNYRAPVLLTKLIAADMVERGIPGSIVNIASTRGFRAYPGDAVYGGLKAALIRSTQSMALDLAPHGIRVNCVAPGATQVRFSDQANAAYAALGRRIPLRRVGQPADVGHAVAWLASDEAAYVTGTTLQVDGGLILPGMPERTGPGEPADTWGV